jgi:hypothetical protein
MMCKLASIIFAFTAAVGSICPAIAQVTKSVDFSQNSELVTVSYDGVEVTLQPFTDKTTSSVEIVALIKANGFAPISIREGLVTVSYHPVEVGIGKLDNSDPVPSVLLGGYSGGAHCCATLIVITPNAGKLKTLEFEAIDGGPETEFPKDINADGIVDLVRQDDSFRYQFSSGAGSVSPPRIFNIYKGQIVDVSDQPAYRPLWLELARNTRVACADRSDLDRNGACIALAAAGARLGNYSSFLREAVANANSSNDAVLPEGCETELVDYVCPKGKEIKFYTFETAANWFLREQGYIQ